MAKRLESILVVPDTHAPFHDQRAWDLMIKVGKALKPDHIVHIGDLIDFYSISKFTKDPSRKLSVDSEIKVARTLLDDLDSLGASNKHLLMGNHDDRFQRYLFERAPELVGIEELSLPYLLGLKKRGWDWTRYRDDYKLGKAFFTHDAGFYGVNALKSTYQRYQHNVIFGHSHRFDSLQRGNAIGERHFAGQFGWLGDFKAVDYTYRAQATSDWAHGFGIGYLDKETKHTHFQGYPIVKYRTVFNGKIYEN